jgi:hypothetical protein
MNKHLNNRYLKNDKEVLDFINEIYKEDNLLNNMLLKLPEEEFKEFVLIILDCWLDYLSEYKGLPSKYISFVGNVMVKSKHLLKKSKMEGYITFSSLDKDKRNHDISELPKTLMPLFRPLHQYRAINSIITGFTNIVCGRIVRSGVDVPEILKKDFNYTNLGEHYRFINFELTSESATHGFINVESALTNFYLFDDKNPWKSHWYMSEDCVTKSFKELKTNYLKNSPEFPESEELFYKKKFYNINMLIQAFGFMLRNEMHIWRSLDPFTLYFIIELNSLMSLYDPGYHRRSYLKSLERTPKINRKFKYLLYLFNSVCHYIKLYPFYRHSKRSITLKEAFLWPQIESKWPRNVLSHLNVGDLFTLKLACLGTKNQRLTLSDWIFRRYVYYIFIPYNFFVHELRSGINSGFKFVFYVKNDPKLDLISKLIMSITIYWVREEELPNINKSCLSEISIKDILESLFEHGNEYLEK